MDSDMVTGLLSSPLASGGTIASSVVAILYFVRKGYLSLKADSATTEAVTTSLSSQTTVIQMLRDEVSRLGTQVQGLQDTIDRQSHERKALVDQLTDTQQSLKDCMQAQQKPGV